MNTGQRQGGQALELPGGAGPARVAGVTGCLFELPLANRHMLAVSRGWLSLGLLALLLGGLFSILIVLSRTPFFQGIIPWVDFFHTALVVHVDLTVLVWFLGFTCLMWNTGIAQRLDVLARPALLLAATGAMIMAASPFTGAGNPLMSNYVPVLQNPLFLFGLATFGAGFGLQVTRTLAAPWQINQGISGVDALRFGLFVAAIASLLSVYALAMSWVGLTDGFQGEAKYDRLFWGFGHVIQFSHTQLLLIAWLWLAGVNGIPLRLSPRVVLVLFALGLSPLFAVPLIYTAFDVSSGDHLFWFTQLMKFGGVLGALPVGLAVTWALVEHHRECERTPEYGALVVSVVLFGLGGVIGFLIRGSNVTVPAHYHGCIVGITVAFMGLTYHLLPRLGFGRVHGRAARWQPWIYGGGQLAHIVGLAWSGGYGVARKVAGEAQVLERVEQLAGMALMGLGGLVSVAGGLLFVLVVGAAVLDRHTGR